MVVPVVGVVIDGLPADKVVATSTRTCTLDFKVGVMVV